MRLIDLLELRNVTDARKRIYSGILLACLFVMVVETWFNLFQDHAPRWRDFEYFHAVGRLVWEGRLNEVYYALQFEKIVHGLGNQGFLPWPYPPQFSLLMAAIASPSPSASYVLFITASLLAYLLALKRLNPEKMLSALFLVFPGVILNIRLGQNGFLTAALIGWTCALLLQRKWSAGFPLGCLVIKPHVAITLATYTLVTRRWGVVILAFLTVAASCLGATLILGYAIWPAFFNSLKEAGIFLELKAYPFYPLVTFYATLTTLGAPSSIAFLAQLVLGLSVLASIAFAAQRLSPQQTLGLTVVGALLISPYANSYDTPIIAVGFALILPDLIRFGRETERLFVYFTSIFSSGYALIALAFGDVDDRDLLSPSGFGFLIIYFLCFRILLRSSSQAHAEREHISSRPAIP